MRLLFPRKKAGGRASFTTGRSQFVKASGRKRAQTERIYFHNPLPGQRGTGRAAGGIHPGDLVSNPDQSHVSGGIGLFLAGQSLAACLSLKDSYKG
jgi:hypothetical protein